RLWRNNPRHARDRRRRLVRPQRQTSLEGRQVGPACRAGPRSHRTPISEAKRMILGSGKYRYSPVPDSAKLPSGLSFVEVVAMGVDSRDRAFVFCRGEHPVIIFESDGTFVGSWGEGLFKRPHGITIGTGDVVWCADDKGHVVRKFSADGKLLQTLGTGQPTDTGIEGMDYRTITRPGPPFNMPTNVAIAPGGDRYITDGYGN